MPLSAQPQSFISLSPKETPSIAPQCIKTVFLLFDNGLIIIYRIMEILNKNIQCHKCALVESIVQVNELMIQEQIKLIKTLQAEKEQLENGYHSLQQQYQQLSERLKHYEAIKQQVIDKEQQTEPLILQLKKENSINSTSQSSSKDKQTAKSPKENPQKKQKNTAINKQNIEQHIPIVMIRKDEQYFSRKRKNSYQEQNLAKEWLKAMDTMGSVTSFKFKEKTLPLVKKGIPHELRHIVWPIAVENQMALTDELYFELLQRRNNGWMPEDVKSQISKDICRSFSGRTQYESKVGLREQVTEVLELFHLYRPDVSYIQGMTYPVIVLTIIVGKVKAFSIFSNMVLANPFFKRLFTFQQNFIQILASSFDLLLLEYNEDVAINLKSKHIDSQTFLVEWFFTVFSRSLSFQGTLKFWDYLLYAGEVALFRLALAIIDLVGPRLMDTNYQETIGLIQGFGGFGKEKKLIDSVSQTKLTAEKLHKTIERVQRHFEKGESTN